MPQSERDLSVLKTTVENVTSLISQLLVATQASTPTEDPTTDIPEGLSNEPKPKPKKKSDVNALDLAHDASSLIRAHSTKISLLIINKPFTPTAICTVLRELSSGPLPALASAVEVCDALSYTDVVRKELQWRVEKVLKEFAVLVGEIPLDGNILSIHQRNGTGNTNGKGSLANTGVVWQACDELIALKKLGIAGLVIQKAEQYRDTLKDALEELKEWGDEEPDEEDGTEDLAALNMGSGDDAQDDVDAIFGNQRHIPVNDTNKIRERLESSLRRLRLISLLYDAVTKRRFKTLPALPHPTLPPELSAKSKNEDPGITQTLDEVLIVMKRIPDIADQLAGAFYELDVSEIEKRMDECFFAGFAAAELLVVNWEGQKDEFSTWAQKFQVAMKKGW